MEGYRILRNRKEGDFMLEYFPQIAQTCLVGRQVFADDIIKLSVRICVTSERNKSGKD
jgi:hypothetical protein